MQSFTIQTHRRDQMLELTDRIQAIIDQRKIETGCVTIFVPHTTAGITINENAYPDVVHDMLRQLDVMVPWQQSFYQHGEGNSAAHVKASMMGSSVTVFIEKNRLKLGRWQGIWFCEFDGPRTRDVWVKVGE